MKNFINRWKDKGDEKSDTHTFWLDLLHTVFNLENPGELIEFEKRVGLKHVSYIDAYIPSTKILIEQKSQDVPLAHAAAQSDGKSLTPFEQAKRYSDWLPVSQHARWIILCNFKELWIYDMEKPKADPEVMALQDLTREKLKFLIEPKFAQAIHEEKISIKAGELVGKLYSSLLKRRDEKDDLDSYLKTLNIFCVRIVFLLYAEDAGLFEKSAFHDYLLRHKDSAREALMALFTVLDQMPEERDPYISSDLASFPYVNGGIFEGQVRFPQLEGEPLEIILHDMSEGFDWSEISPTIFGAVFESTLNPETRRKGGMHYTSIKNIHKVIDPLFLEELNKELDEIINLPAGGGRSLRLTNYQKRLANLKFLDPACGSGNFLTETYLCLRRLENRVLEERRKQIEFVGTKEEADYIKVSIGQFYGIEINDFAVSVARTALWIAEAQMYNETRKIVHILDDFLPLRSYNHIVEGNALSMNWDELVRPEELNYIMGNPPFVGYSNQTEIQKKEILSIFTDEKGKPYKTAGKIDYVAGWYFKAASFIHETKIKAAFVSTNSITQGEQVSAVFKPLKERFDIHIDFAHKTFKWNNEVKDMAQVHVVIIGFSSGENTGKHRLYDSEEMKLCKNINFYLADTDDVFIEARREPISLGIPLMLLGNLPRDGGYLLFTKDEHKEFLQIEPKAEKFMKQYMGADEFINNVKRYCLWLVEATPEELKKMPFVRERISSVKKFRLASTREATRKLADIPWLFAEIRQPKGNYIIVPLTSSENRRYVPLGFMSADVISSNAISIIPDAKLYHFGVLTSSLHMAWMRLTAGRLKSDYRYSNTLVYNNFIWPSLNEKQQGKIEATAQGILDARAKYPESSFAALYDPMTMPPELVKAHKLNDEAVLEAYGFSKGAGEEEIVAELMKLYKKYIVQV